MTTINTISELLDASNVTDLAPKNFSKIFHYIGKNQASVSKTVFSELASVMETSTEAMTLTFKALQSEVEKANERADKSSLTHMGNVINSLHENGVSDKRIDSLLPQLLKQAHESSMQEKKGNQENANTVLKTLGTIASLFVAGYVAKGVIETNGRVKKELIEAKPKKFWES
jgi:hypothetical protein